MNREVHVRIWERPEVRALRATRHEYAFPPTTLNNCSRLGKPTFAGTRGNEQIAPFSAIPVGDHLPPSRVLRIAGTAENRCGSQINDGSKSDFDLR